MDDEIEPGKTAQTPQWRVSSAIVAASDEMKIALPLWKCETSHVIDAKYWVDLKITGNIELIGTGTKPSENLVWTSALSMEPFQCSQWEGLWMHLNQHLITYCEILQSIACEILR